MWIKGIELNSKFTEMSEITANISGILMFKLEKWTVWIVELLQVHCAQDWTNCRSSNQFINIRSHQLDIIYESFPPKSSLNVINQRWIITAPDWWNRPLELLLYVRRTTLYINMWYFTRSNLRQSPICFTAMSVNSGLIHIYRLRFLYQW